MSVAVQRTGGGCTYTESLTHAQHNCNKRASYPSLRNCKLPRHPSADLMWPQVAAQAFRSAAAVTATYRLQLQV